MLYCHKKLMRKETTILKQNKILKDNLMLELNQTSTKQHQNQITEEYVMKTQKEFSSYFPKFPFKLATTYPIKDLTEISYIDWLKRPDNDALFYLECYFTKTDLEKIFNGTFIIEAFHIKNYQTNFSFAKHLKLIIYNINTFYVHFQKIIEMRENNKTVYFPILQKHFLLKNCSILQFFLYQYLFDIEMLCLNKHFSNDIEKMLYTDIRIKKILFDTKRKIFNIMLNLNIFPFVLTDVLENYCKKNADLYALYLNTENKSFSVLLEEKNKTKNLFNIDDESLNEFVHVLVIFSKSFSKEFSEYVLTLTKNTFLPPSHDFIQNAMTSDYLYNYKAITDFYKDLNFQKTKYLNKQNNKEESL